MSREFLVLCWWSQCYWRVVMEDKALLLWNLLLVSDAHLTRLRHEHSSPLGGHSRGGNYAHKCQVFSLCRAAKPRRDSEVRDLLLWCIWNPYPETFVALGQTTHRGQSMQGNTSLLSWGGGQPWERGSQRLQPPLKHGCSSPHGLVL